MNFLDKMPDDPLTENSDVVERLAELEYQQWCQTVQALLPDLDNRAHWERRIAIPYSALTAAEKPRYWLRARNVQQLLQDMQGEHEERRHWLDQLLSPSWDKAAVAIICVLLGFFGAVIWVLQAPQFQWLCF